MSIVLLYSAFYLQKKEHIYEYRKLGGIYIMVLKIISS